jgi:hypothetical protein
MMEWMKVKRKIKSVNVKKYKIKGCGGIIRMKMGGNKNDEKVIFKRNG